MRPAPAQPRRAPRQGAHHAGAASLVVLLLLLMASLLVAGWAQRNLLTEQAIAGSQLRRSLAFEAAEAGLAWAQAMLNSSSPVGEDCLASSTPGTANFATRYLGSADAQGRYTPRLRAPASAGQPLQIVCMRAAGRWTCACPAAALPRLSSASATSVSAFALQFEPASQPGSVHLVATGCSHLARPCLPLADEPAEASTRLRLTLALLPAVATPPAATLTTIGDIDAGAASLGLHNADARSGGLAAHSGGAIVGSALRVQTTPGGLPAHALLAQDAALVALAPGQLFARHFGSMPADWAQQAGVTTLDCRGDCSTALQAQVDASAGVARIRVAGDLQLRGSVQIGSSERPVVLVVDGALQINGPVSFHGLLHADSLRWDDVDPGAGGLLRGAALLSRGYGGNAGADFVYDPALMRRLQLQHGSWLRVPGSWRDF